MLRRVIVPARGIDHSMHNKARFGSLQSGACEAHIGGHASHDKANESCLLDRINEVLIVPRADFSVAPGEGRAGIDVVDFTDERPVGPFFIARRDDRW